MGGNELPQGFLFCPGGWVQGRLCVPTNMPEPLQAWRGVGNSAWMLPSLRPDGQTQEHSSVAWRDCCGIQRPEMAQ